MDLALSVIEQLEQVAEALRQDPSIYLVDVPPVIAASVADAASGVVTPTTRLDHSHRARSVSEGRPALRAAAPPIIDTARWFRCISQPLGRAVPDTLAGCARERISVLVSSTIGMRT